MLHHRTVQRRTGSDVRECTAVSVLHKGNIPPTCRLTNMLKLMTETAWGGTVDPFILLKFLPYQGDQDPVVSLVIFEWKDEDLIGVYPTPEATMVCKKNHQKPPKNPIS